MTVKELISLCENPITKYTLQLHRFSGLLTADGKATLSEIKCISGMMLDELLEQYGDVKVEKWRVKRKELIITLPMVANSPIM